MTSRRVRNTGSLRIIGDHWYGRWYVGRKRIERALGPVRRPGTREGLTRSQADAKMRKLMGEATVAPDEGITMALAGDRLLAQLRRKQCAPSHIETVDGHLRCHLIPYVDEHLRRHLHELTDDHIEDLMDDLADEPRGWRLKAPGRKQALKPKTVRNIVSTMHSIFELAQRKQWVTQNVCKLVEWPTVPTDGDIHFLTLDELQLLIDVGLADGPGLDDTERRWRRMERLLYITAAMTGARQGELLAVRWIDPDWLAMKFRIRKNYVRGEMRIPKGREGGTPPMADRLGAELERYFKQSAHQADEDLVFGDPETGRPLSRRKVSRRFAAALDRAGVRHVRFHDLRHTFGTHLAAEGVPIRAIQEWYGHKDIKTTMIYVDYAPGATEAELIDRAFSPLVFPHSSPKVKPSRAK